MILFQLFLQRTTLEISTTISELTELLKIFLNHFHFKDFLICFDTQMVPDYLKHNLDFYCSAS